jgi:hypothetical protein
MRLKLVAEVSDIPESAEVLSVVQVKIQLSQSIPVRVMKRSGGIVNNIWPIERAMTKMKGDPRWLAR